MTPEQEESIAKAIPLIKEFVTRPEILAQLKEEGKRVVTEEIARFANELEFRKQERLLRERQEKSQELEQANCPHIAGSSPLSECRDIADRTSIVWHRINSDLGDPRDIGICTICQRKFFPEDEDYKTWRKKPSFNRLSCAGVEYPMDEDEVAPENQFIPVSITYYGEPEEPLVEKDFLELNFDELNKRSTFEIRKVMEYVREERRKTRETEIK